MPKYTAPSNVPAASLVAIMQTTSDVDLVKGLAGNHPDAALAECIRRYGSMILRTATRITGDPQEAEDVCQAVLLVLLRKAGTLQQRELLGAWLYRVTVLAARKLVQGRGRRLRREREVALSAKNQRPSVSTLPTGVDRAIDGLPEIYRQVIVAHYLQGQSHAEVASRLGINEQTVRKRASLGIDRLRKCLAATAPSLTVATLSASLSAASAEQAAAGTLVPAQVASLQAGVLGQGTTHASGLAQTVINAMFWGKAKVAAGFAVALLAGAVSLAWLPTRAGPASHVLADFNGSAVPMNKAGEPYPSLYFAPDDPGDPGGVFTSHIETRDAVKGNSLRMQLTRGQLKAQFNPRGKDRWGFAREYIADPTAWRFNTVNRLTFWIKMPTEERSYRSHGESTLTVGTYCKRVADPHEQNDDAGGGHFYHRVNVPAAGHWTQVVLNMHPHIQDGRDTTLDPGILEHPTGEAAYNYFDTLTRFYIGVRSPPAGYPADYLLDEVRFEQQPVPENDRQVYSIAATHVPPANRIILTWSRPKDEESVRHEVRYAFRSIHEIGWAAATPAPGGLIAAAGPGAANGMVYDTTALPLAGQSMIYLAIRPQNAERFSQVAVPLTLK